MFSKLTAYIKQRRDQNLKMKILKYASRHNPGRSMEYMVHLPTIVDELYYQITNRRTNQWRGRHQTEKQS